jgi:hypothetical protein
LQGCSSGGAASAPDAGPADVGAADVAPEARSDGPGEADGGGCNAPKDEQTRVSFQLPTKVISFDAQTWMIPASNSVAVSCGGAADCCNPPLPATPPDCAATPIACEAGLCTVKRTVTAAQVIDLKGEVPALSNLDQPLLCEVSLLRLRFLVSNTMNVAMPPIQLYLAPLGVNDPADATAQTFGTVPAAPAGSSPSGDVLEVPATDSVFTSYARSFGTRFMLIASTVVSVPSGSPQPSGTLLLTVLADVSATL